MYGMPDPLSLLESIPPPKERYKQHVKIIITSYHEREQRQNMSTYTSAKYFNTFLIGLSGKIHPAIDNVFLSNDVKNMRAHLKFLAGDYLSNDKLARQGGKSPICSLCDSESETYSHIITRCHVLKEPREKMLKTLSEFCHFNEYLFFNEIMNNEEELTQFILDPTSMNLSYRININDKKLPQLMYICRNFCNSLHNTRMKKMKEVQLTNA